MEHTLAMVLVGGRGKRMGILCRVRPKPALPFAGRFRIIDFSLSNCVHSQVRNVAILTDYRRLHMAKYLRRWYLNNPGLGSFRVLEPQAGYYKGTADAVYQNVNYLKESDADAVLILAGDTVYKMDYRRILDFHRSIQADITLGVVEVPIEQAHRYGIVKTNSKDRVIDYIEKPEVPQNNLASMGIYVFNKAFLMERISDYGSASYLMHDLTYNVVPEMVKRDRFFAYRFDGYWRDIGTIEAFYEANMEVISQQAYLSLDGRWPVLTAEHSSPLPANLDTSNVVNSIISPGCVVRGHVENSILSPNVCIEDGATVRNSVLMSNVSVDYHAVVDRCIVDEQVNIGKFCYIGFGGTSLSRYHEITVIGKAAAVPPYTAIGQNCKVLPQVGPSDFITSAVPSGSVVF
ncbi:glucose-1-phosphate adenylyltransferase family protein [Chloroflexota bacterium]